MKKRIVSLLLAFLVGITFFSILPVCADSTSSDQETVPASETELLESTQFKENMTFFILLNHSRIQRGLTPLAVTRELLQASRIRAEELGTKFSEVRPDDKGICFTVLGDTGVIEQSTLNSILHLHTKEYHSWEVRGAGKTNPADMYDKWMSGYSSYLYRSETTHAGLGHSEKTTVSDGVECHNTWALNLLSKYFADSIEVINVSDQPYAKGMSITDMGIVLKLNVTSVEGKKFTSYMPLIQSMCTGYSSSKSGKQTIKVTYKDTTKKETKKLTASFTLTTASATAPATPEYFDAKGTSYNKVTVTWSPVDNANEYELYRSTSKKSGYKQIAVLKPRKLTLSEDGYYTYTDKDRTSGKMYYYKIRATIGSSKGNYTKVDEAKPNIDAPDGLKVKSRTKTSITVKWSKVSKASNYRVYYSTKKNGKYKRATKKSTSKTSFTIKKLKKGKTYYIKVLSYRKGNPGKYSDIIEVKTKK